MEIIGFLILFYAGIWLLGVVFRAIGGTASAAARTVTGKGSLKENIDLEFHGMGVFQIRSELKKGGIEEAKPFDYISIQAKGLLPVNHNCTINFVTSVIDKVDDENMPVFSTIEDFQEDNSTSYQYTIAGGRAQPNQGYIGWTQIGLVIPGILIPPCGGDRELTLVIRITDANMTPDINDGFGVKSDPAVLGTYLTTCPHNFPIKGYMEAVEERNASYGLSIKLAMAVAFADGSLDETEGKTISYWIKKIISGYSGAQQEKIKTICNDALKEAYEMAKNGTLSISDTIHKLHEIADDGMKYQAIELCLDVMAADGAAEESELQLIRKIANSLNLDYEEIQRLKEQRIVKLDTSLSKHASIEELLGIESDWAPDDIKRHLRKEFSKWNGRLNSLNDDSERDNAQHMLDIIAEARKKYV